MPSSVMWRRIDIVWTDVSEEREFIQDLHDATSLKTAFFNSSFVHFLQVVYVIPLYNCHIVFLFNN
jgi:hypothetical protein